MTIWTVRYQNSTEAHENYDVGWWEDRADAETAYRAECHKYGQDPDRALVLGWDDGFVLEEIDVTPSSLPIVAAAVPSAEVRAAIMAISNVAAKVIPFGTLQAYGVQPQHFLDLDAYLAGLDAEGETT